MSEHSRKEMEAILRKPKPNVVEEHKKRDPVTANKETLGDIDFVTGPIDTVAEAEEASKKKGNNPNLDEEDSTPSFRP